MEEENKKTGLQLHESEFSLCKGLLQAVEPITQKYTSASALTPAIGEKEARQLKHLLDLFRLFSSGDTKAMKRISGDDADVLMAYSLFRPDIEATANTVIQLSARLSAFLKETAQKKTPPQKLYIADCHFYHNRLCTEMDRRGFTDFEAMNEHMIGQWNSKVRPKDDVYILGDFCIAKGNAAAKILYRLNGKLHLIVGNHDRFLEDRTFDRSWFRSIDHYSEIRDNGRSVILSHYPLFCYKGQYRRDKAGNPQVYMLYGHVHNTQDEQLVNRFIMETRSALAQSKHASGPEPVPCNMINCFCMFSDYQPMTLDEWIVIDKNRRSKLPKL